MAIICPIDEHFCTRKECLTSPNEPNCIQVARNLAYSLGYLIKTEQDLNLPAGSGIDTTQLAPIIQQSAQILGVDLEKFVDRIQDDLEGAGASYEK